MNARRAAYRFLRYPSPNSQSVHETDGKKSFSTQAKPNTDSGTEHPETRTTKKQKSLKRRRVTDTTPKSGGPRRPQTPSQRRLSQ